MNIVIRLATSRDTTSLSSMPPYFKCKLGFSFESETIFVAEDEKKIFGAISVGNRKISFVCGDWKDYSEKSLGSLLKEVTGPWISKLYVLPGYRHQGIGTKLVKEALKSLEQKEATEAYAGVYMKNEFRETSIHIFEKNGFKKIGLCICPLDTGYCRGTLLKKTIMSNK